MNLDKYRIYRTDPKNVTIQRLVGDPKKQNWVTQSYHGNSVNSLISGLFELIMQQHTPESGKLSEQLVEVRRSLVSGIEEVKKMAERCIAEN